MISATMSSFNDISLTLENCMGELEWIDWTLEKLIEKCGRTTLEHFSRILWRNERPNVIDVAQSGKSNLVALSVILVPEQSQLWTMEDPQFKRNMIQWYSVRVTLEEAMVNNNIDSMTLSEEFFDLWTTSVGNTTQGIAWVIVQDIILLCYSRNAVGLNMIVRPFRDYYFELKPMFVTPTSCTDLLV